MTVNVKLVKEAGQSAVGRDLPAVGSLSYLYENRCVEIIMRMRSCAKTEAKHGEYGSESLDLKEMQPTFDSPLANVTVKEGATAVLPCSVKFLGRRQVIWTDQWSTLFTFEDRRIIDDERVSVERPFTKDWNLHIRNVQHKDQGLYNCQINTNPVKIKTVHLTVQVPAKIVDELSSSDMKVRESETVTLICNVTGIPMPTVTWYRHSTDEDGVERQSEFCPGTNIPPEIYLPNKRIGQEVGKETILECLITANPQAVSKWTKDGGELKTTGRKYRVEIYSEAENSITLSLRILNVEKEDFGKYTCEASSIMGRDTETMVLFDYSRYRQTTTTTTTSTTTFAPTIMSTIGVPRRPAISQDLQDTSRADIRFITQGHPRPTLAPPSRAQHYP
ncbi:hypothetical protein BaRGS_00016996, partial [Batillaria attramentaria]